MKMKRTFWQQSMNVVTHFIQINDPSEDSTHKDNNHTNPRDKCFLHMATTDDDDVFVAFTGQPKNAAIAHSASGFLPKLRFGKTFDGIPIDTRAAKGSGAECN